MQDLEERDELWSEDEDDERHSGGDDDGERGMWDYR